MDTMTKNDANEHLRETLAAMRWQTAKWENEENQIVVVFPIHDSNV